MRNRLLIVHPFLPEYRVPFFEQLRLLLADSAIDLHLASGGPAPSIRARNDDRPPDWATPVKVNWINIKGREICYRQIMRPIKQLSITHVVVEQAIKNLETYSLLARRRRVHTAMWGLGGNFPFRRSQTNLQFKAWLTRQFDWFFAYTEEGADWANRNGLNPSNVTVVRNSTDTKSLNRMMQQTTDNQIKAFLDSYDAVRGKSVLFMGGIDSSKGVDLLIQASRHLKTLDPDIRIFIGGDGPLREQVIGAETAGLPIRYLGRLEGGRRALAMKACELVSAPTRIGLLSVDALAAGLPIITTTLEGHGPEFGYQDLGTTCHVTTGADPLAFAKAVSTLLSDIDRLKDMQAACRNAASSISIEAMAANFHKGAVQWIESTRS